MVVVKSKYNKPLAQQNIVDAIKERQAKYFVLDCGRGFGKSMLIEEIIIKFGLEKKRKILVISSTDDQLLTNNFDPLKDRLEEAADRGHKMHKRIVRTNGKYSITLKNGTYIKFKSGHKPDSMRGANQFNIIICDEFAYCNVGCWNEILQFAKFRADGFYRKAPMVELVFICSTPNGFNHFYTAYERGVDPNEPDWKAFKHKSIDNPLVDPDIVSKDRQKMPEGLARQEYDAEFVEDGFGIFKDLNNVCVVEHQETPIEGESYFLGVDPHSAGEDGDSIAYSIFNMAGKQVHTGKFRNSSMNYAFTFICGLMDTWQPVSAKIETNIEAKFFEDLSHKYFNIYGQKTTSGGEGDKVRRVDNYRYAVDTKQVLLSKKESVKAQHNDFVMKRTASGKYTYRAKDGKKDDLVIASLLGYECWEQNKISTLSY